MRIPASFHPDPVFSGRRAVQADSTAILTAFLPWDARLAHWISNILSPPILALVGVALAVAAIGPGRALFWGASYALLVIGVPIVYILVKVRQGAISDFHMRVREQRIRPLALMLGCAVAGWLGLWVAAAPKALGILAGVGVLQAAFQLLVTLRWKISGHSTAVASLAVFLLAFLGSAAAPSLLAIPLVAWARVRLNRHDLMQTIGGTIAGIIFVLLVLALVSWGCAGDGWRCVS